VSYKTVKHKVADGTRSTVLQPADSTGMLEVAGIASSWKTVGLPTPQ